MPSDVRWPSGWTISTVEQLTLDGAVTYGVVQPGPAVATGTPMLRVNNFRSYGLDTSDVMRIANDVESKYSRTRIRANDVLITVVGSVGQVAVVPVELTGWNLARAVALLRPRERELAKWIALCLHAPTTQHALGRSANTTVQTTINLKDLRKLELPMPPAAERAAIEEVFSAFDDRIELLRQTNASLESIAQALFKSWFIDFDPVRAKAEGREPEGMDAATAALFPAEFEESALGLIPKGWRVGGFGDLAVVGKGSVSPMDFPSRSYEHYSLPSFDNGRLPVIEDGSSIKSNKTPIPEGAVLQSKLNPHIPRVWFLSDVGEQAVCSTEFLPWVARAGVSPGLVYCVLRSPIFEVQVLTLVTGTSNSHQRVKADQVASLSVVVAPPTVAEAFASVVDPILRKTVVNRAQARRLTELRDALLPQLISGKLRPSHVKEQVEETTV